VRGWYGESARHSLAARGITTHLYHGTTTGRLKDIRKSGLDPFAEPKSFDISEDYIYFTTDLKDAKHWATSAGFGFDPESYEDINELLENIEIITEIDEIDTRRRLPVILRVRREDIEDLGEIELDYNRGEIGDDRLTFDVKIPPELIEVRDRDGKWRRIR